MFYLYEEQNLPIEQIFEIVKLWRFPENDLEIIKRDWEKIVKKVKDGRAHEISEGDTYYLGACTKGANAEKSRVRQPFSEQLAQQRAFGLKKTYLEVILAKIQAKITDTQPAIKLSELRANKQIEELIYAKFRPFIGMTVQQIGAKFKFDIDSISAKNRYARLTNIILGVKTKNIEEFVKADIAIKTIRLRPSGKPKENMSFPYFKYMEIIKETWDTSVIREQLERKFFFVIFQYTNRGDLELRKVMFWNMPYQDLETHVKKIWSRTINQIKNKHADDLPKSSEDTVCHVRPHGRDSRDTIPTPHNGQLPKKCFWLNKTYLKEQIGL